MSKGSTPPEEPSEEMVSETIKSLERLLADDAERRERAKRRGVAAHAYERLVRQEIGAEDYAREIRRSVQVDSQLEMLQAEHERLISQYRPRSPHLEQWVGLGVFLSMLNRYLVLPVLVAAGVAAIFVHTLAHLSSATTVSFLTTWIILTTGALGFCAAWNMRRESRAQRAIRNRAEDCLASEMTPPEECGHASLGAHSSS